MPERHEMPERVDVARTALRILGGLGLITAAVVVGIIFYGAFVLRLTRAEHALLGSALFGGLGLLIIVLSLLFGSGALIAASAISRRKAWGRIGGLVLGGLTLPLLPVGTVLGLFVLTGLTAGDANRWFGK